MCYVGFHRLLDLISSQNTLLSRVMATMQYNYPVGLILSYDIYSDLPLISRNDRSHVQKHSGSHPSRQVVVQNISLRATMLIFDEGNR